VPRTEPRAPTPEEIAALDPATVRAAARILSAAESALFVTGAGISADSGLPTYRGIGGLYDDAHTDEGIPIEEALSGEMLRAHPEITWKYVRQIEAACRGARFNRAHEIIAELEARIPRAWVLTQNVDGFHRDAGSRDVIEIHGDLRTLVCTRCRARTHVESYAALPALPELPTCARCSGMLRPGVVLFGETIPAAPITELERQLAFGFDVVVIIGTTALFPYVAAPVVLAARNRRPTIEINPGQSEVTPIVGHRLPARAVVALEAIATAMG
jgi:NAD-dependent deacetylase